ncbi:MAG TPA: phage holin family protein [Intrasporangium sp.]|uniref:phage holin family protein n=1 Tax=Intrasporangium sp. TaxID=1925024 RepID=UPI002D76D410|nr:phage holin family protein [Intrasporangium sp.]HET7398025.1 phage holin family protein [Intrasporangium sp.]
MSTTPPGQERTLGQLVASASQDISALVRGEIALAKLELSGQVKKAGLGGALLAAAGVVAFYSVYFIFTTLAEGLQALGLPRWLSFLIVTVLMLLIAGVLAFIGIRRMKTVKPVPEKAISNAQQAIEGVKRAAASPHPTAAVTTPAARRPTRADATTTSIPSADATQAVPTAGGATSAGLPADASRRD